MTAKALENEERSPGGALLHAVPLLCIVVLVVNDHYLKQHYGSAFTGKLSDFAGLGFFPLFLQSLVELGARLARSRRLQSGASSLGMTALCCVVTGVLFTLVKTWGPANAVYRTCFGAVLIADPTDLVALPALGLAYWAAKRRVS